MAGVEVGYKVEGLTKVVRALKQFGLEVNDLKDAFAAIAAEGAQKAAAYAPRRSGRLAGDIRGNRAQSKASVIAGRARIPYAGPINYGWGRLNASWKTGAFATGIRGQYAGSGFMQKADEEMRPRAVLLLEENINAVIRQKGLN